MVIALVKVPDNSDQLVAVGDLILQVAEVIATLRGSVQRWGPQVMPDFWARAGVGQLFAAVTFSGSLLVVHRKLCLWPKGLGDLER